MTSSMMHRLRAFRVGGLPKLFGDTVASPYFVLSYLSLKPKYIEITSPYYHLV